MNLKSMILTLSLAPLLASCATGNAVRKQITQDLINIVETQDCATACESLKMYIKLKLGGTVSTQSRKPSKGAHKCELAKAK